MFRYPKYIANFCHVPCVQKVFVEFIELEYIILQFYFREVYLWISCEDVDYNWIIIIHSWNSYNYPGLRSYHLEKYKINENNTNNTFDLYYTSTFRVAKIFNAYHLGNNITSNSKLGVKLLCQLLVTDPTEYFTRLWQCSILSMFYSLSVVLMSVLWENIFAFNSEAQRYNP